MDSSTNPPSTHVLLALENGLAAALDAAQSAHDETLAHLDTSRQTLVQLLENEAIETALYVEDAHLQMRALRDVVQLEMDRARRDVASFLEQAKQNATATRAAYAQLRQTTRAKREALKAQRFQQTFVWRQEVERVAHATNQAAQQMETLPRSEELPTTRMMPVIDVTEKQQTDPVWAMPFIISLVVGACLWLVVSVMQARRSAFGKRQRILYSDPLQQPMPKPITSCPNQSNQPRKATCQVYSPTLYRRLRPAWSPTASTASTVSPPVTPISVMTTSLCEEE